MWCGVVGCGGGEDGVWCGAGIAGRGAAPAHLLEEGPGGVLRVRVFNSAMGAWWRGARWPPFLCYILQLSVRPHVAAHVTHQQVTVGQHRHGLQTCRAKGVEGEGRGSGVGARVSLGPPGEGAGRGAITDTSTGDGWQPATRRYLSKIDLYNSPGAGGLLSRTLTTSPVVVAANRNSSASSTCRDTIVTRHRSTAYLSPSHPPLHWASVYLSPPQSPHQQASVYLTAPHPPHHQASALLRPPHLPRHQASVYLSPPCTLTTPPSLSLPQPTTPATSTSFCLSQPTTPTTPPSLSSPQPTTPTTALPPREMDVGVSLFVAGLSDHALRMRCPPTRMSVGVCGAMHKSEATPIPGSAA
ncbi:hypothetical protein E2C01_008871 [Portunus trituberculatus]|uniref:Uncharacterized protein n=1 Tax=Portunus trituberculatus TaxID=210409 RepID=A0A5B7D426_PORTR|nr:hypothetical protein [Portunus trituberculatus]